MVVKTKSFMAFLDVKVSNCNLINVHVGNYKKGILLRYSIKKHSKINVGKSRKFIWLTCKRGQRYKQCQGHSNVDK